MFFWDSSMLLCVSVVLSHCWMVFPVWEHHHLFTLLLVMLQFDQANCQVCSFLPFLVGIRVKIHHIGRSAILSSNSGFYSPEHIKCEWGSLEEGERVGGCAWKSIRDRNSLWDFWIVLQAVPISGSPWIVWKWRKEGRVSSVQVRLLRINFRRSDIRHELPRRGVHVSYFPSRPSIALSLTFL
jgi:hypothetical protein